MPADCDIARLRPIRIAEKFVREENRTDSWVILWMIANIK